MFTVLGLCVLPAGMVAYVLARQAGMIELDAARSPAEICSYFAAPETLAPAEAPKAAIAKNDVAAAPAPRGLRVLQFAQLNAGA